MKNCKQIATEWGLSERTVNDLCKKNKIDGAIKVGKMWKIPDDAKKPIDGRITSGKYVRHSAGVTRKPLPIGISDYVRAQADYYYVDKTMLIKEFLDQKPLVSLFTRPRRFGKTLNMDMLRVFFEISEENTSKYFEDKAIWQCGEEYRNQQGQYPVVFLTFKDVKFDSWKATLDKISLPNDNAKHIDKLLVVGPLSSFGPWELEYEECFGHKPSVKRLISGISKTDKQDYLISSRTSELTLISYASLISLQSLS